MVKSPIGIGATWDRTTAFIGAHLGGLTTLSLLTIFVPSSLSGAIGLANGGQGSAAASLATLALTLVMLSGQLAITAFTLRPTTAREAGATGLRRLLPAIGVYLLLGLIAIVLTLPILLLYFVMGGGVPAWGTMQAVALPDAMALPGMLTGLVVLALFLWAIARLCLTTAVVVAERQGARAITRSFTLTRGMTWKLIGVILLYIVVLMVATLAAQGVFGAVVMLATGGSSVGQVLVAILVSLVTTAFTVLQTVFVAMLYRGLAGDVPVSTGPWDRDADAA